MKRFFGAVMFAAVIASASPALAVSCSDMGNWCRNTWAVGALSSFKSACVKEVQACAMRCKSGEKVFIGVQRRRNYPVNDCR